MQLCRDLSPELFMAELALTSDAILIDVRTTQEVAENGMIEGAVHYDFLDGTFEEQLLDLDRFLFYFLYDQLGKRSRMACELMAERGFLHACYLVGGKAAWDTIFKDSPDPSSR